MSQQGESALPSFDLNRKVGRKIKLQKYRRAVVLCVVDMADFDGSLPRAALQELLPSLEQGQNESQATLGYRLVIAASKVDLLPSQATAARLQVLPYSNLQARSRNLHLVGISDALPSSGCHVFACPELHATQAVACLSLLLL